MRHTQGTANPSTLQANTSPQQSKAVTYGSAGQPAGATSQPRTGIRVNASALRAQRAYAQSETRAPEAPKMPDVSVAPIPPARPEPQQKSAAPQKAAPPPQAMPRMELLDDEPEVNPISPQLLQLAERYVTIFKETNGPMDPAQKATMVEEVARFYSVPTRQGRLEALVNSL